MAVWTLSSMTWEEVGGLDLDRSVAILPVGAIEAHGPHLPLDTDVIIGEAMAREAARLLSDDGYEVVILPTVPYTSAPFASEFPGTVSLKQDTAEALLVDLITSLSKSGFRTIAIANAHLDPAHLAILNQTVARLDVGGAIVIHPDLTKRPWGGRLSEEFRSGACHAGQFESSIVLAERPESVREDVRPHLPPNPISLSEAIRDGKRTFGEAGGDRAYFGYPDRATAAEGKASVATLGAILRDAVVEKMEK